MPLFVIFLQGKKVVPIKKGSIGDLSRKEDGTNMLKASNLGASIYLTPLEQKGEELPCGGRKARRRIRGSADAYGAKGVSSQPPLTARPGKRHLSKFPEKRGGSRAQNW